MRKSENTNLSETETAMGQVASRIEEKLKAALSPAHVEVSDESHLHAGHVGARPEGETHFRVVVVAASFEGVSRLERQRRVMDVLSDELSGPVHALAIRARAPSEEQA
jgi:BolA protein